MCRASGILRRSRSRPSRRLMRARQSRTDELIDFTPELHAKALELVKHYKMGPMFLPAVVSKIGGPLGCADHRNAGRRHELAGRVDTILRLHIVFAPAANAGVSPLGLVEPPAGYADIRYLQEWRARNSGSMKALAIGSASDAPKVSAVQAKTERHLGQTGCGRCLTLPRSARPWMVCRSSSRPTAFSPQSIWIREI